MIYAFVIFLNFTHSHQQCLLRILCFPCFTHSDHVSIWEVLNRELPPFSQQGWYLIRLEYLVCRDLQDLKMDSKLVGPVTSYSQK